MLQFALFPVCLPTSLPLEQAPDDKPLAAAKTVLSAMTRARGDALLADLQDLPAHSAVRQYHTMYMERFRSEGMLAAASTGSGPAAAESSAVPNTPAGPSLLGGDVPTSMQWPVASIPFAVPMTGTTSAATPASAAAGAPAASVGVSASALDPFSHCSALLTRLGELSKQGVVDSKPTIDALWELKLAHPEVEAMLEAGVGEADLG